MPDRVSPRATPRAPGGSSPCGLAGVVLAAALAAGAAHAQYKWVDAAGRVNYGDRPAADARVAQPAPAAHAPSTPSGETPLPWALRSATTKYPVVLYTTADCDPCDLGREHLSQRGVPFTEKRVQNADDVRAFNALKLGAAGFPVLTVGTERTAGFEAGAWTRMLDAAAYPKSSLLAPNQVARRLEPLAPPPQRAAAEDAGTADRAAERTDAAAPGAPQRADASRALIPARQEPVRNPIRF